MAVVEDYHTCSSSCLVPPLPATLWAPSALLSPSNPRGTNIQKQRCRRGNEPRTLHLITLNLADCDTPEVIPKNNVISREDDILDGLLVCSIATLPLEKWREQNMQKSFFLDVRLDTHSPSLPGLIKHLSSIRRLDLGRLQYCDHILSQSVTPTSYPTNLLEVALGTTTGRPIPAFPEPDHPSLFTSILSRASALTTLSLQEIRNEWTSVPSFDDLLYLHIDNMSVNEDHLFWKNLLEVISRAPRLAQLSIKSTIPFDATKVEAVSGSNESPESPSLDPPTIQSPSSTITPAIFSSKSLELLTITATMETAISFARAVSFPNLRFLNLRILHNSSSDGSPSSSSGTLVSQYGDSPPITCLHSKRYRFHILRYSRLCHSWTLFLLVRCGTYISSSRYSLHQRVHHTP